MWSKGGHPPHAPTGPMPPHWMYVAHPMYGYGKGSPVWTQPSHPMAHHKEEHPTAAAAENHAPKNGQEEVSCEAAKVYKDKTRTLAEWYSKPDHEGSFFIGDGDDDEHHRTTVDLSVAVRGLCMEYFEHHVSPLLRSLQSTTEQQQLKLQELQTLIGQDLRETVAVEVARRNEQNAVSTLVRLQEISTTLQKKADVNSVPSMSQWKALNAKLDKAGTTSGTASVEDSLKQLNAMENRLSVAVTTAESNHQALQEKVEVMQKDLQHLTARPEESSKPEKQVQALDTNFGAELHKVKALVAAAGANFNRQIRDLKSQVKTLQERNPQPLPNLGSESLEERWPGRGVSQGPPSDAGSEQCSDVGSVTASLAGSVVAGMAPEEKAEMRKMQVVVSAAATTFSKEIKEVRKHLREVQDDLSRIKGMAGL